jgi:hypothetical protein
MHQVTRAINDAANWRDGLRLALERLCESEGWQAGYVYLPDRADPDTLVPTHRLPARPAHAGLSPDDPTESIHARRAAARPGL